MGVVLVQDQQIFSARDVQKGDGRPGGYVPTGGHGGVVGSIRSDGIPMVTYRPARPSTGGSEVNISRIPDVVEGVRMVYPGRVDRVLVQVKEESGLLREDAMPVVTLCKYVRCGMADGSGDAEQEVEILARIARNLERSPLSGFVLEGSSPYGRSDESMMAALEGAVMSGLPVVAVGRGNADGFVPPPMHTLFIPGSNLTAHKARLLLIACLLRFGAPPPAQDPWSPSKDELQATLAHLEQYRRVFATH